MEIRLATAQDYAAIFSLFKNNDFIDSDMDYRQFQSRCDWQYVNNPSQIRYQWLVDKASSLVAHYAMIALPFIKDGQALVAGIGSNLVIDESCRDGMLFLKLQKHFLKKYTEFDIDFTYSLVTRPGVLKVHLRTGFMEVGRLPVLIRPIKATKIFNHFIANPILRTLARWPLKWLEFFLEFSYIKPAEDVQVVKITTFDPSIDEVLEKITAQYGYAALRNHQTLNWRFTAYPFRAYEIFQASRAGNTVGYMVTRKMPMKNFEALAIVDLICEDGDLATQRALLAKAHQLALSHDVDVCASLQNPHHRLARTMHRYGYLNSPESFTLCTHAPAAEYDGLQRQFSRWLVSWFDNDYV